MKEIKFEDNMNRLNEIVDLLEKGDVSMDESIKLYEEGLKLSKLLKEELKSFEERINELNKGNNDEQ